ncbi:hypothetical protein SEA_WOOPER_68 [Gordonia phage Wooper]|nr:hypothetical protein SEA_WOOPER_68 [Gordonia phage Wooper]
MNQHLVRLTEHHEIGPVYVDRSYLALPEGGPVEEVSRAWAAALAPFVAEMEADARAWAEAHGVEISLTYRTDGNRRMAVWVCWDVEVGRASYDDQGRERWAWSAFYDDVSARMPA